MSTLGIPADLADRVYAAWQLANEKIPEGTPYAEYWRITIEREEALEALYGELADAWQGDGGFPYILLVDARHERRAAIREARRELERFAKDSPSSSSTRRRAVDDLVDRATHRATSEGNTP